MQIQGYTSTFEGINTIRTQLVNPKDKDPKLQKSGIIYHYKCPHLNCPEAYIGETGRELGDRVSEHLKAPSFIYTHSNHTGHPLDPSCFNIIHKVTLGFSRTIKEAMFIRVNDPLLNRNLGKYQLLCVWDSILQETPMLQLKPSSLPLTPSHPYWDTTPTPAHIYPNNPLTTYSRQGAHVHNTPKTPLISSPMHLYSFPTQQHHQGKLYHFIC